MTYEEYFETDNGKELNKLFLDYLHEAKQKDGAWWEVHALEFAVMMELWNYMSNDIDCQIPEEAIAETADGLFKRFINWARFCMNVAIVLTLDYGDERFECINNAFSPEWKRVE